MSPVNFYLFTPITRKKRERETFFFQYAEVERDRKGIYIKENCLEENENTRNEIGREGGGDCIVFMKWQIKGDNVKLGRKS